MLKVTAKDTASLPNRWLTARLEHQITDVVVPRPARKQVRRPNSAAALLHSFPRSFVLFFVALLVLGFAAGGLAILRGSHSDNGPVMLLQVEKAVGRHYLLPTDEQPVLATVTDVTLLNTPFLKQAKNDDQLLIYAKAKIVIIYRPSIDRIVAVGPVELDSTDHSNIQQP